MASIDAILNADLEDLRAMSRRDLAKNVSILASAANKRLKRLEKSGKYSPAAEWTKLHGGKFSVAGKNENQLLIEYRRVADFLTSKTSSLRGVHTWQRDVKKGLARRLGESYKTVNAVFKKDAQLEANFWKAFGRIKSEYDVTILYRNNDKGFKNFMKESRKDLKHGDTTDEIHATMKSFIDSWIEENPTVSESDLRL